MSSIDDLCDTDSERLLFTLNIVDPKYNAKKPYDCRIAKTNYPNIAFTVSKLNNTNYRVYLPSFDSPSQTSFFDLKNRPVLLIEIMCLNNFVLTHKRTVDFKICKKVIRIQDILLKDESEEDVLIQFNAPIGKQIAKLAVLDWPNRETLSKYEFYMAQPNNYLEV